jgi:hypothetical protein
MKLEIEITEADYKELQIMFSQNPFYDDFGKWLSDIMREILL